MKRKLKILIFDDVESDVQLIVLQLKESDFNFDYKWAENGDQFIEAFKNYKPNLILSDYRVPGFSGMEALEYVRKQDAHLPFILVTGTLGEEKAVATILKGANDFVLKDRLGRLPSAIVRSFKVTEAEKEAETATESLKKNESHFRALIENSHDFIIVFDDDDRITYSSPALQRLLGLKDKDVKNKRITDLIHEEDKEERNAKLEILRSGRMEKVRIRYRWKVKSKGYRWMECLTTDQRKDEGINGFISNIRDVHDQYIAEQQLREKNALLDAVMNNLHEGVIVSDLDGKFLVYNDAASRILGIKNIDEIPLDWNRSEFAFKEDRKTVYKLKDLPAIRAARGEMIENEEMYINDRFRKGGLYLNINAGPLYLNGDEPSGGIVSFSDITDRKYYQLQLETTLNSLEKMVEERTSELLMANSKLESANKKITHSIEYAKNIQKAITLSSKELDKTFANSFIINKPRDIVSGDFIWMNSNSEIHLAVVDCTGHGVPGAMLSMIGNEMLDRVVVDRKIHRPEIILEELDKYITRLMTRTNAEFAVNDGMDLSMVLFDFEARKLYFAGAQNSGVLISKNELKVLPADRFSIGGMYHREKKEFNRTIANFKKGDRLYLFSDGLQDQFNGETGKKFTRKRLYELLIKVQKHSLKKQKDAILMELDKWKGSESQIDDIAMIGVEF